MVLEATSSSDIRRIVQIVHDNPLCLSKLKWLPAESVLCLFFGKPACGSGPLRWYQLLWSRWDIPLEEWSLEVCEASSYAIDDPAEIECYTFEDIRYNKSDKMVSIITCEGLRIDVHVDALHLRVQPTGRGFGTRRVWYVAGAEIARAAEVSGQPEDRTEQPGKQQRQVFQRGA